MIFVIELATALECQKQLLMSSISNLGGRKSLLIYYEKWSNIESCTLRPGIIIA